MQQLEESTRTSRGRLQPKKTWLELLEMTLSYLTDNIVLNRTEW